MLIIPSYFKAGESSSFSDYMFNNITLKIGQVIKANYPDSNKDKNAFITYDVLVNEQKDLEQYNAIYYDCMPTQSFGSAADYVEYSIRTNMNDKDQNDDLLTTGTTIELGNDEQSKKLLGATVVIACIGGDGTSPVIVGYLPSLILDQNKNYKPQSKDDGRFLKFNFNGIKIDINNDGELFIQRQGPTNNDGTLDDKSDGGKSESINSFFKIDKEGQILISTTAKEDASTLSKDDLDNVILIDKKGNITIKIDAGKGVEIKQKDSDATFTLGDGAKSVAIAEELKTLYDQLKQKLDVFDNHLHPTGMGPSGPPNPMIQAPSWADAIVSKSMKLPK